MSEVESVIVKEDEFELWNNERGCYEINAPSNYYIINALSDRVFYLTRDRKKAQDQADIDFPPAGKYTIKTIRDQKTKSKREDGSVSCSGSNTRKCFAPRLKNLK